MRHVVGSIQLLSIPARREKDLSSKSVGTIVVGEHGGFGLRRTIVVEATVADCLRCEVVAGSTLERVPCDHAETRRECFESLAVTLSLKVVDGSATDLGDAFKSSLLVAEEQGRGPVVAVIPDHCARRTSGLLGRVVVHGEIKSISSHDGVQVVRHLAWTDDWISTLDDNWRFARESPECRHWGSGQCDHKADSEKSGHLDDVRSKRLEVAAERFQRQKR